MEIPGHPLISADPNVCFGKPVLTGTRMRVCDILGMMGAGDSIADIQEHFPEIEEKSIRAALLYAAEFFEHPVVLAAAE
ncbi:MAG: DUF433 domain-containing protein [Pseudomonadota bacterium]